MKIIDLLNKIANGEEVPKRVSINGGIHGIDTWVYDEHYEDYINGADEMLLNSGMISNHLTDEVEIIEEDKKIKKLNIQLSLDDENKVNCYRANNLECDLAFKINEIIDYLNSRGDK